MEFRRFLKNDISVEAEGIVTSIATEVTSAALPTGMSGSNGLSLAASAFPVRSPNLAPRSITIIREVAKFGLIATIGGLIGPPAGKPDRTPFR